MHNKPVTLVTGANKGIGLQIAKDLAARGFTALVGSRNLEHGETAAKSAGADARAIQLDVTGLPRMSHGTGLAISFAVGSPREDCDVPKCLPAFARFGRHPNSRERALKEVRHALKVCLSTEFSPVFCPSEDAASGSDAATVPHYV